LGGIQATPSQKYPNICDIPVGFDKVKQRLAEVLLEIGYEVPPEFLRIILDRVAEGWYNRF
jgi:hypothetical protein